MCVRFVDKINSTAAELPDMTYALKELTLGDSSGEQLMKVR